MKVDVDWGYYVELDKCHGYRTKRSDFERFWRKLMKTCFGKENVSIVILIAQKSVYQLLTIF